MYITVITFIDVQCLQSTDHGVRTQKLLLQHSSEFQNISPSSLIEKWRGPPRAFSGKSPAAACIGRVIFLCMHVSVSVYILL